MKIPKKTKELEWSKIGDFYILVDPKTNQTFNLDSVSFLVWFQCDGETSVDDIVEVFSVDGNRDIVKAAVSGILNKLEQSGLIKWV